MSSNQNQKILIIESSLGVTGAFRSILLYASELKNDYIIEFLIPIRSTLGMHLEASGVGCHYYPYIPLSKSIRVFLLPFSLLYQAWRIRKLIDKNTIIHCNDLINLLGIIIKLFVPKVKLIYHIRLMPDSYIAKLYPLLKRLIEWKADKVIAVSRVSASPFKNKVTVLPNCYNPIFQNYLNNNRKQGPIRFLYLANYTDGKGHYFALKAFKSLYEKIRDIELEFVGSTFNISSNEVFKQKLITYAKDNELLGKVVFNESTSDVITKYLQSSIFLNFSESESFSRTVLDSMVLGVPVVATKSGGPQELINHMKDGILIEIGDETQAVEAMYLLAENENIRISMGNNARQNVVEKYSLRNGLDQLKEIYSSL